MDLLNHMDGLLQKKLVKLQIWGQKKHWIYRKTSKVMTTKLNKTNIRTLSSWEMCEYFNLYSYLVPVVHCTHSDTRLIYCSVNCSFLWSDTVSSETSAHRSSALCSNDLPLTAWSWSFVILYWLMMLCFVFQDQFDNLEKHTSCGIDFLERYTKFLKERADIELSYAKQIR